ncbi:MAG TPA: GNAT family N-acetyltransferase [Nitrosomonas mobilis]|nr:GNAT family N-acetyltransferase [Nitrosomonas mobilis]
MTAWKERLNLLKYRGGFKAAVFWIIKAILRIEIHFLYTIDLTKQQELSQSSRVKSENGTFRFLSLDTAQDISMAPQGLIDQIGLQSGSSVKQLIKNKTSVYAFIDQASIVSQMNICRRSVIQVDAPTYLDIKLSSGDAFLGYLFTYTQYRGMGTATLLLIEACAHMQRQGYLRIVTHIRSTNASSLNTFNKCGWSRVGWIFTSTAGRLLLTYCPQKIGITILASKRSGY